MNRALIGKLWWKGKNGNKGNRSFIRNILRDPIEVPCHHSGKGYMGTKTQKEVRYLFLQRRTREQILGPWACDKDA